jgi:hypothetical protein
MPAAIKPYSIAVAPESLDRNFNNLCFTFASVWREFAGPTSVNIPVRT